MDKNSSVKLTTIDSTTPAPGASQGARRATEKGIRKGIKSATLNLMDDWSGSITVSELMKVRARIGA